MEAVGGGGLSGHNSLATYLVQLFPYLIKIIANDLGDFAAVLVAEWPCSSLEPTNQEA